MKQRSAFLAAAILVSGLALAIHGPGGSLSGAQRRPPQAMTPEVKLLKTPAEEAGYARYSQNEAIAAFLSRLAAEAPEALSVVGRRTVASFRRATGPATSSS